ncbi:MAG TPA: DUF4190 domain-containing protein [Chiayiivirga sp.]|jgi:hypothetical protein|uniref:DUF4190 domain-containing protein n=1 Tax=Denitratimonas tolerans TaxID=1338420 RepID=A0AAW9R486_9GAMM|nr:DUF4190 domain-containing protein [Xanthomonadaceae bacterium]MDX9763716.1 DUF4190 domain-containing protein [Chiayiivirga sp.]MEB2315615.1 DUF4190 domain-containing protein [Xanthomonadaceae bacterium]HMN35247.1 DUF4190 domain-containing protein [Chiayiivirga sp.]HRN58682.1 DUF4190 domain-containing protein [Chiayiivirga sp.]
MNTPTSSARTTSTLAVVSLISGIVSWLALPMVGAIVAIITGHMGRSEIRRSGGTVDGDGLAIAGLVLGYLQLTLVVLGVIALFVFFGGLAFLSTLAQ